jgi:hypothetical protein
MPPGLRLQIWVAIAITASALLLPTALTAGSSNEKAADRQASAGSISTSTSVFSADDYPSSAFTDWEG